MKEFFRVLRTVGMPALVFLIVLPTIAGAQGEIPITTKSDEARKIFLEGLKLFDNVRWDEAREFFTKAIEKDPDFATAYLYRASIATSAMDFQTHLQKAAALAPKVSEGERLVIAAMQAGAENNPVKALQLWEQLTQKFPKDKRAQWYLGWTYSNRGEDDKAIAEFEKTIAIDKDYAPVYNFLGYAYYRKGNYQKAEETFKTYIRLLPGEPNPHDSLADLYTKMGRHQEAIEHYKKALELSSKFTMSQRKIGDNLLFMGKYDEARAAYREAMNMETTPTAKVTDMLHIARSYLYEGKSAESLAESEKALTMASEAGLPERAAGIHSQRCDIYLESGDLAKAEQSLAACKKVVIGSKLSPAIKENFAKGALFDEALIAAKKKDFAKAMAKADEYKAKIEAGKDPKEMENHHELAGRIAFEKGDYAKAIAHLKQADQQNPYTLYLLAVAESKAGDKVRAAELFKTVAHWNENSLSYAFVRSKAMMTMEQETPN